MACVTRGPPVTSLIVPRELKECLLLLADYAPPEDRSGTTDVRGQGSSGQDSVSGCMVPPARHGPQRGACLLWIPSQVLTSTRMPLGLLPRPRDYLGATVRGRSHPGPQGEPEAH